MKGIKPINTQVSNNKATRRLNLEDEQFQVGDALASPRVIPDNPDFHSSRKTENGNQRHQSAGGRNYNNRHSNSLNKRKTDRTSSSLKFGKSPHLNKDNDPRELSYIKPWRIANKPFESKYMGEVGIDDQPYTMLDEPDYMKRLKFEQLKQIRLEAMCKWKQKDTKGMKKNAYIKQIQKRNNQILKISEKTELEKLDVYTDRFPLLTVRKTLLRAHLNVKQFCFIIINSKPFDNISLAVIIANSVVMMFDNSAINDNPNPIFGVFELWFQYAYTVEMVFKILGLGFIMGPDSYIKDTWNLLDFFIVMMGYMSMIADSQAEEFASDQPGPEQEDGGINVSSLRTFRVLRPLKSISSVKGLKVLIVAVISALPMLKDTILILMFFFIIFSIACTQMYAGKLKQRCLNLQTGLILDELCHVEDNNCPGGYKCVKSNSNPNYGVTNWDNIIYSFQTIFQFVTLEGWSEVQRDMQITSSKYIPMLFMIIVLVGAFFLLNLTLAVINSKFTESQKKQEELDRIEMKEQQQIGGPNNEDNEKSSVIKDEMSIAQYINARIYAKKMIEFLRMRQEVKRIEIERRSSIKLMARQQSMARRQVMAANQKKSQTLSAKKDEEFSDPTKEAPQNIDAKALNIIQQSSNGMTINSNGIQKVDIGQNVIVEDVHGEHRDDLSEKEQDKLDKDIQEFLMKSRIDLQRQGVNTKDFRIPKAFTSQQKKETQGVSLISATNGDGGPTMKSNIGSVKKGPSMMMAANLPSNFSKRLAEEFDIDNVIPKDDQKDCASNIDGYEIDSMASFQLSLDKLNNEDHRSITQHSHDKFTNDMEGAHTANGHYVGLQTPGQEDRDADSGLITSDSDFDFAVKQAGAEPDYGVVAAVPKNQGSMNIKKDVTKAFKKMLTSNHMRSTHNSENKKNTEESLIQSTMFGGSQGHDNQSQQASFDIESKFKKKKPRKTKMYKEDEIEENYLQHLFDDATNIEQGILLNQTALGASKHDIRQLQEFVSTKKPNDPFRDLNPLTHKVEIAKDLKYAGTSQQDVFMPRQLEKDSNMLANINKFIKRPDLNKYGEFDEVQEKQFVKNVWKPYQQKFFYRYMIETSDESQSMNEDELQAEEQPFYTPTRINFREQTKQKHTQEVCKRADVLITSTLSLNLYPKDKRQINKHDRITMDQDQYDEYMDEKSAFKAIMAEHKYQTTLVKEKENEYRSNYSRSFLNRAEFQSKTLNKFRNNVMKLNMNRKAKPPKHKDQIKQERQKHEQNKRASEKRGLPKFDMEMAKKLLEGKFHEEDEEDAEISSKMMNLNNQTMNVQSMAEIKHQQNLARFEAELHAIFEQNSDEEHHQVDEIPIHLRREFNIPKNLMDNELDFNQVRMFDASHKKIRPMWSGQDVLQDHLNNDKSQWIVNFINNNRVWPTGIFGIYKKARFIWRLQVKSEAYDNFFTFFVFLNTCTLAMERYGIPPQTEAFLEETNIYFTSIFIYEMFAKIAGIGIKKYLADTMNWLDGFIVLTSIFELIYTAIAGDSGGVSALNTLRLLRTFRVFRILRLLRNLESMQTILNVMSKSYMSFVYITMLMNLFIIIFTLLGMQLYGGYWKDDEEGLPANNFDGFGAAFFTIFQVLTMENWQSVLFVMNRNNTSKRQPYSVALLLMAWIFLGNFILLNLFLAILLDAFLVDDDGISEEELEEMRQKKAKKKLEKQRRKEAKMVLMDTNEIKKMNNLPALSKFYFGQEKAPSEEDLEDLDEEQIIAIFKEQGVIKKEKTEMKNEPLFVDIECKMSFFLFAKTNPIRILCYKMIKHPLWENIVIVLISLSSIKLAYDTFFINSTVQDFRFYVSTYADLIFNWLFIFEMVCKLIALGVTMDENSYLRDTWNQMDFFIVMASIFDMALEGKDLKALKILRMLRTLRPLRFLTHNVGMKLIVNALIGSVGGITNVLLVVAVVYLIFAILFVNLYKGRFFYCSIDPYILNTRQDCEYAGGNWELYDHNFDSANRGWTTLYIVASLEGWPDIFIQTVESTEMDLGPELGNNSTKALLLFLIFIYFGSFFFLNFFIGVLFMRFNKAQEEEQKGYTDKDMAWMDIQRLILQAEPDYEATNVPKSPFRKKFHDLVSNPKFDALIMSFIMLNMAQMALLFEGNTKAMINFLDITNYIFTVVFLVECILKFIAFGLSYFNNSWNKFDFFVVSASLLDVVLDITDFSNASGILKVGPKIARVMRVLRVTRILRLAGKAESLQAILQTIMFSIPALANVFFLLILIYFMLSVLANFNFNNITEGEVIDPDYKNFKDFYSSFVLLFALSTGEDWNKVMFDCSRTKEWGCVEGIDCGTWFSYPFFFILILVCSYIMLNLFILVIIQQFEKYYLPDINMLALFKDDQISFMKIWKELTQDRYSCLKMKENQLTSFFRKLGDESETLGFQVGQYDDGELKKQLLKMAIKSDNGYIFFNEMLYRCMRRKYGNMKINKKMQIFELRTQYSIYLMTLKIQNKREKQSNEEIFNAIIKKENGVNPFLTVMNFKISFKTWLKVARLEIDGKQADVNMENQRTCKVDIEVEDFFEYTSEEDPDEERQMSDGNGSNYGSNDKKRKKKKKHALAKFERKMTARLNDKMNQSSLGNSLRKTPLNTVKAKDLNMSGLQSSKYSTAQK